MVVAQLIEWSLLTQEVRSSDPVNDKNFNEHFGLDFEVDKHAQFKNILLLDYLRILHIFVRVSHQLC